MCSFDFICVDETGSTNDDLLLMAEHGAAEGTCVAARHQLLGRGRRGRRWDDQCGKSALVSVLLRPKSGFTDIGLLAAIAAVAVADVLLRDCGLDSAIKWPNDILVRDKKIAGILIEGRQTVDGLGVAVGVGVNIGQVGFPENLSGIATSVALSGGVTCSSDVLSESIAREILDVWAKWNSGGREDIFNQWVERLWGIGRAAIVESLGETFNCTIDGANQDGSLRVVKNDGEIRNLLTADSITVP